MDIVNPQIAAYTEKYSEEESPLLKKINRETHLYVTGAGMLSGPVQGRLLALLSKILNPRNILEIGTYTGYATLCLAEGLQQDGIIYTIDHDEELQERVSGYFNESTYKEQIKYLTGQAEELIPQINDTFDLVFIDADKENYALYYDRVFPKLSETGVVVADNVLWKGKVLDEENADKPTRSIIEFNKKIKQDSRVEMVTLTIRDGLMLIRKK